MPVARTSVDAACAAASTAPAAVPSVTVHERCRGTDARSGSSAPNTDAARPRVDQRAIQPRAPLRRVPERRPQVDALRAGQRRVEHEHRVKVRRRRRLARARPASDTPSCPAARRARAARRADRARSSTTRAGSAPGWNAPEVLLHAPHHVVGVDVADDDERGVVRDVPGAVEAVEVVARHRLQIARPADGRVVVAVRLEGRRGDLGVEHLFRIVVAAIELREDDRALGLAVVGMVEAVRHPLGLDEQHAVERVARGRLEVRGLIDPGVAVPAAAELLDDALHLVARECWWSP